MKPCIACGHPLQNAAIVCSSCEVRQTEPDPDGSRESRPAGTPVTAPVEEANNASGIVAFVVEVSIRVLMVGMLAVPVCFACVYLLLSIELALLVGALSGFTIAFTYTLVSMYFQAQGFGGFGDFE